jgi:hypothetical protein
MATKKERRVTDAEKLRALAQAVQSYRWVQRRLSETLTQGIDSDELVKRRERLGRELDRLSQDALTVAGVDLFAGCAGLPD